MENMLDYVESAAYATGEDGLVGQTSAKCESCYGCKSCKGPNCKVSEPTEENSALVGLLQEYRINFR